MSVYLETQIDIGDLENQFDKDDKEEMLECLIESIGGKRVLEILKVETKSEATTLDLTDLSIDEKARALTNNIGEESRMKEHLELFYD
jgi:hypothetical protein